MGDYMSNDPFSVCFNILKMKYKDYDDSLTMRHFVQGDKVNVFINIETVYKHLSMIMDLERKIIIQRDFDTLMISNILNLAAHYKRFFVTNGCDARVFLYSTDLESEEFNQFKYNEDYRSYYLIKYNSNPKFVVLTDHLKGKILPDVRTYCEFIPNVFYVASKNIEGSLIPYLISKLDESRKNVIIGGELYDTQYSALPNFVNHYIRKGYNVNAIYSDINGYLKDIMKKDLDDDPDAKDVFQYYNMYSSLMAVLGDKIRSIDGLNGVGVKTLQRYIENGITEKVIQLQTTNPEILGDIFHDEEMKENFINNYYCSSILAMYNELTEAEKSSILKQLVNRSDPNTLQAINRTKFYNHPLLLEGLLI